jgi:hypothetical protein
MRLRDMKLNPRMTVTLLFRSFVVQLVCKYRPLSNAVTSRKTGKNGRHRTN